MNTVGIWLEHPLVAQLGWCLVHSVWEIAAVALVAALLMKMLRNGNAQGRYLAACASLVVTAASPVVTLAWAPGFRADAMMSSAAESPRQGVVPIASDPEPEDQAQKPGSEMILVQPPQVFRRPALSEQIEPLLPLLVAA
jgi:hypothetical protein